MLEIARYERAIEAFDAANAKDPNIEQADGKSWPRELLYAIRLSDWVRQLAPSASEPLRLAARSQHLCRWEIPRNKFPMDKPGYLSWRNELKQFHARRAGEILSEVDYGEDDIKHVQNLVLKKNFPADPESRILEDALCLVFLHYQFSGLASRTDDAKMINALQKSWKKMTERAREAALKLHYPSRELELIQQALSRLAATDKH